MIKHIVMWKLKKSTDAQSFRNQLETCRGIVPGMMLFEVATRTPALEANCDVVLYSVFADEAALESYQSHPQHLRVADALGALNASYSVLDYET
ncbi:MAG: Dabb family protein [Polaromonas sp.]|nr:Dabb family protein [Polaromonas sp.]